MKAPLPPDETQRLAVLRQYAVLDTPAERAFDDLTRLAAHICQTPIALVTLVDESRQWFKSKVGLEAAETPRNHGFCAHTILNTHEALEVHDAWLDPRFADDPLVTSAPHIRFYAGVPLVTPEGHALGSLCVIDRQPQTLTAAQLAALHTLGRQVVMQLELRRHAGELARAAAEHQRTAALLQKQFDELSASKRDADRLLELGEKSRHALLSVLEDGKLAGENLRASEERFRELAENIHEVFWITNAQLSEMIYVSPAYEKIWGRTCESLYAAAGMLKDAIHPEDQERVSRSFAANALNGTYDEEYRITQPGGEMRWIHDRGFPLKNRNGIVYRVVGVAQDITEQKKSFEALRLLETCVSRLNDIVLITEAEPIGDLGPRILFVNDAFERRTGYSREEVIGRTPRILQGPKTQRAALDRIRAALEAWQPVREELLNYTKSGEEFWLELDIVPVADAKGWFTHWVAIERDITGRRKLEEQFRQSQKMEGIGQLAAGVAHDFNNILADVQMQNDLLEMGENLSPAQKELTDGISAAVERAAALTRQLLLFSRKEIMREHDLNLNQSIEGMLQMVQRTLGEHIRMQLKLAAQPMFLHADAGMLDQVLLNLTVNARDAMPKGGVLVIETDGVEFDELTAAQFALARPGSYVRLSVSDTGSGIPAEILPKIFDPFFSTKDVGKGTGLGLATVFGIVQQHRGWINVYSEVGRGTTFRIYLPRLEKISAKKSIVTRSVVLPGGPETILFVEDDKALNAVACKTLNHLGYRVRTAFDGHEALKIWKEHSAEIHLVLTDMVMPGGINGIELGAQLLRENPKLKIIYSSGYSAEVAGKDFPLHEGVNFLTKPFQLAKLAQILRASLDA